MESKVTYFQKIRGLMQLRRALVLVWESARKWTMMSLGCMALQALLPLATLYLIKLTVDAVAAGISAPDKVAALREVLLWIVLTGIVTLLNAGLRSVSEIIREYQSHLVTDHVTDAIHRQSAQVDLSYYENPFYYDTLYRAQQEAPYRPNRIVQALTQLGQNGIALVALAGLLLYLHWAVALILFVAVVPGIMVKVRYADRLYKWQASRTETERWNYEYHRMLTGEQYAKEVRLFNLGNLFRKRYRDSREVLRDERLKLARSRSLFDITAQTAAILALFGMLAFIASRTVQGLMTLGDMVMYFQAFQRAQGYLQEITGGLAGLYEDSIFLNHFYDFMDLKSETVADGKRGDVPRPVQKGIALEQVSFKYQTGKDQVLTDIDLTIKPGEIVALVGDNGAGKTTLAKLLCRLYDPARGRLSIDGTDFREFDTQALRRQITMIFQDYIHYPLSARENIWIGDVDLNPEDERIRTSAHLAGADGVISRLPDGYDTLLGNRFNGGVELSIGEWQKVALARAFLRDAQLIILDEPTSAMSARVEHEIFQAFKTLLKGRSALLISHRFSTVRMADTIYVLEEGKIVERGSHQELMKKGGHYSRMYNLQAQHYSD